MARWTDYDPFGFPTDPRRRCRATKRSGEPVQEPGGVIYTADPTTPVRRVPVQSVAQHDGTCFTFASPVNNLVPVTPVMTLDQLYSRPYAVR